MTLGGVNLSISGCEPERKEGRERIGIMKRAGEDREDKAIPVKDWLELYIKSGGRAKWVGC